MPQEAHTYIEHDGNGLAVSVNGAVRLHVGASGHITLPGLAVYFSNSQAKAAGVPVGGLYRDYSGYVKAVV